MANRVTGSEVKEIFQTTLTASEVEVFITPANQLVTEKLAASGLSDDRLKEIERWLAAHLLAVRDPRKRRQQIGESNETYHVSTLGDYGLKTTYYGQQVLLLDTTGIMHGLGGKTVSIAVVPGSP